MNVTHLTSAQPTGWSAGARDKPDMEVACSNAATVRCTGNDQPVSALSEHDTAAAERAPSVTWRAVAIHLGAA